MQSTTDESHLRDLSPGTTLRAFTEKPMPFDITCDEYNIFACIETLTPAERDLGARVAKAAQRLKSWSEELAQWGWSGTFEPPSDHFREQRRNSLERRIREHVKDANSSEIPALDYWGSMLSVEVEAHEARLDDISEDLIELDIEELKGHVLDMHPSQASRQTSSSMDSSRRPYTPVDDFSFLITQTLLSALPHHYLLKERLSTWSARVTILREAPRFLENLKSTQNAMRMGWEALGPPEDTSDDAFNQWKAAVDTIATVLRGRVSGLGRLLDRWLDMLEGRDDCVPDHWIDTFEAVENDFSRWTQDSHIKAIMFDVRRDAHKDTRVDSTHVPESRSPLTTPIVETARSETQPASPDDQSVIDGHLPENIQSLAPPIVQMRRIVDTSSIDTVRSNHHLDSPDEETTFDVHAPKNRLPLETSVVETAKSEPQPDSLDNEPTFEVHFSENVPLPTPLVEMPLFMETARSEPESDDPDDESIFEEGDTVVHHELDEMSSEESLPLDSSVNITTEDADEAEMTRPHTPKSRRHSINSDAPFSSSPLDSIEDSPSLKRAPKTPRPALNAAMTKRRTLKITKDLSPGNAPWPPTQFSHKSPHTVDDLESKISDILTTIPAHIRLTTRTGADARNLRSSSHGVTNKDSTGYLRAHSSVNRLKSPELTLSPAKQDSGSANGPSSRKSASTLQNNDIKLYHLTQPGKEQPQKLFIRRVGENGERVMVRVGGGWADLGEYLRQYAEHHGRRTVSSENFEILGLEPPNIDSLPGRPESVMSKRDRAYSGSTHAGSTQTTPVKSKGSGTMKDDTPPPPMPTLTPNQTSSDATSAPSTASSKVSWKGHEVGLAGPKSKKLELSNDKLDWIEGMMKQARSVSSSNINQNSTPQQADRAGVESRSESRAGTRNESRSGTRNGHRNTGVKKEQSQEFGVLGKAGGTKRIFLRGGGLGE
jgi:hypothetical protein